MKKMLIVIALTLGLSSVVFACNKNTCKCPNIEPVEIDVDKTGGFVGTTTFPSKIEPIGGYIGITNSPLKPSKSKTTCDCECNKKNIWCFGQEVYDVVLGKGIIVEMNSSKYPIGVQFPDMKHIRRYTMSGKCFNRQTELPSLYPHKVKIVKD